MCRLMEELHEESMKCSEEHLLARVDSSLKNIEKGSYEDAEKVEADLIAELDL